MIIVSDATLFIGLARIGLLDLFRSIFTALSILQAVYQKVVCPVDCRPEAAELIV